MLELSLAKVGKGTGGGGLGLGMTGFSGSAGLLLIQRLRWRGLLHSLAGIRYILSWGGADRFLWLASVVIVV